MGFGIALLTHVLLVALHQVVLLVLLPLPVEVVFANKAAQSAQITVLLNAHALILI